MKWTQKEVLAFAEDRFGENTPLAIAVRGNKEMSELLSALSNGTALEADMAMECADVTIFMMQICEKLGYDLLTLVDTKMDINERRSWKKAADGSFQHDDT